MQPRTNVSAWPVLATVTSLVLIAFVALAVAYNRVVDVQNREQLFIEVAKTALNLIFVGVATMLVKIVVEQYFAARDRERLESAQREAAARLSAERVEAAAKDTHERRLKALASLTNNYWNAKKALKIIEAHRSAKSYGEQVRVVIDHRLALQQLANEIRAGVYALDGADEIDGALGEIDRMLAGVIDEWRDQYLRLSQLQKQDEAQEDPQFKKVPGEIDRLPNFNAARENSYAALHDSFERAAGIIRSQVLPLSTRPATIQTNGQPQT